MQVLNPLKARLRHSPLFPLLRPRRFHAYCVGLPKTGTTSVGSLFRGRYRAAHEPLPDHTRSRILATHAGETSEADLRSYLHWRDRELYLEMEASHAIAIFVNHLASIFPEARFVLTVRSPRAWLRSLIDQQLNGRAQWASMPAPGWRADFFPRLHEQTCGRGSYHSEDLPLKDRGLYPIDGYLGWWRDHNEMILDAVPNERLLVLRTESLSTAAPMLARFLDIPATGLETGRSHANRTPRRYEVLGQLDAVFVEERIEACCGRTIERIQRFQNPATGPDAPDGKLAGDMLS